MTTAAASADPHAARFAGTTAADRPDDPSPMVLEAYLRDRRPDLAGPVAVSRFKGGQSNPTYLVTVGERRLVLRRKPIGRIHKGAHAVDREYRLLRAIEGGPAPVPRAHLYEADAAVVGAPFYLMDHVAGRILWDPRLPTVPAPERSSHFGEAAKALAALHSIDVDEVGLSDFGRRGGYLRRQIELWSSQVEADGGAPESLLRLSHALSETAPEDGGQTLVHGDFRFDNLVFRADGPEVLAILDWELATIGDPLIDLNYFALMYHVPPGELPGLAGLDLAAEGLPDERALRAMYAQASGRDPDAHRPFYLALNLFRLAGVLHGIGARARHGSAASPEASRMGKQSDGLARLGLHIFEGKGR